MRAASVVLATLVFISCIACAEDKTQTAQAADGNTVCTFADGRQISIRYPEITYSKSEPPRGKVWSPDGRPMYLFSQTELQFGDTTVPPGAYSLYPIPGEQNWTLVLNSDVQKGADYDSKQDIAKIEAQTGQLPSASDRLTLYFGRIGPKACTLRIDYGKQRAFADFKQK